MGANIFVDPVIVTVPAEDTDRDGVVVWLENLDLWLKEALSAHFLWLHARNVTIQLENHGYLPSFRVLQRWINQYSLDVNPHLLLRNINTYFRDPEFDLENKPGDQIAQTFPLLFVPEDLYPLIDVMSLWYEGASGVVYAIEQQCGKDWPRITPLSFVLGAHFQASVKDRGLDTNQAVLTKIVKCAAYVISGQAGLEKKYELEQLRKNKSGDSPVRTRESDGAEAWRLRITSSGAGWRLHYWHIPGMHGGSIELSNVSKESDATIYE